MRKILILLIALSLYSFTDFSQKQDTLNELHSGKWLIKSAVYGDQNRSFTEEDQKSNWMIFHKDGKYEVMTRGILSEGTWKFNKEKKVVTIKDKGQTYVQKVVKINNKELVMESQMQGLTVVLTLKKNLKKS